MNTVRAWVRVCQSCGHKQVVEAVCTTSELTDAFLNAACESCKSESLDYGHDGYTLVDGKPVRDVDDSPTLAEIADGTKSSPY